MVALLEEDWNGLVRDTSFQNALALSSRTAKVKIDKWVQGFAAAGAALGAVAFAGPAGAAAGGVLGTAVGLIIGGAAFGIQAAWLAAESDVFPPIETTALVTRAYAQFETTRSMDVDRVRTRRGRADSHLALDLWRGLFAGRWTLVDPFDSDGSRFVLARRNEPSTASPLALPRRQRQALFFAAAGWSNKEIGYTLSIAETTVASHLQRGLARVGAPTRAAWISIASELTSAVDSCAPASAARMAMPHGRAMRDDVP